MNIYVRTNEPSDKQGDEHPNQKAQLILRLWDGVCLAYGSENSQCCCRILRCGWHRNWDFAGPNDIDIAGSAAECRSECLPLEAKNQRRNLNKSVTLFHFSFKIYFAVDGEWTEKERRTDLRTASSKSVTNNMSVRCRWWFHRDAAKKLRLSDTWGYQLPMFSKVINAYRGRTLLYAVRICHSYLINKMMIGQ